MNKWALFSILAFEILSLGALFLFLPRIGRRGLLFGVYIGEDQWNSVESKSIQRSWSRRILGSTLICLTLLVVSARIWWQPQWLFVLTLVLLIGFVRSYLRAHAEARKLAVSSHAPPMTVMDENPPSASILPLAMTGVSVVVGLALIVHALVYYSEMSDQIPVHFNAAGAPDRWAERSILQLLTVPLMVLVVGGFMGVLAWLTAHAKPSLRHTTDPSSAFAQKRFRLASSRLLTIIGCFVTGLLSVVSFHQIQIARGIDSTIGSLPNILGMGIGVSAVCGVVYLMVRVGQGGSRLEAASDSAPLTNGLADNRCWKLGVFYFNREDPSMFVEKRFGLGYTINFANRKAVALISAFLLLLFVILVVSLSSQ